MKILIVLLFGILIIAADNRGQTIQPKNDHEIINILQARVDSLEAKLGRVHVVKRAIPYSGIKCEYIISFDPDSLNGR